MPIYEYVCLECGERFDALRLMRDADATIACGRCQSERTTRQLSLFFSQSGGRTATASESHSHAGGGCGGCSGGSCGSCRH
jgi:putative FmdB family regulatory protein